MKLGRIYLIGMPGSGKSFFGLKLSEAIDYPLVDLDTVIEEKEGKEISEIFEINGEDYFRDLESKVLHEVSESSDHKIISTGGGAPCYRQGIEYMNSQGVTVFLETDKEILIQRLAEKTHRPLVQGDTQKRVDELLKARLPIYKKAQISIAHREVDLLLDVLKALKN
ncbi:MAG: shikimate kinase [Marinoscillum sp.]